MTVKWMRCLISRQKKNLLFIALQVLNESEKLFLETKFGMMVDGSVLSYQCSFIPADFNVYSNLPTVNECDFNYLQFPDFPLSNTKALVTLKIKSNHTLIKLGMQVKLAY